VRAKVAVIGICGDDSVDLGEECDGGNNVPGDGCDENCQNE
jgi:cysteine-rich repeat protein